MWFRLLLWLPPLLMAENPCLKPNLSVPFRIICDNILNWDRLGRQTPVPVGRAGSLGLTYGPGSPSPSATPFPETIYDCMTIECICGFVSGAKFAGGQCTMPDGSVYKRVQRKEYRMLTYTERSLYREGFIAVRGTIYQELSTYHSTKVSSPAAHGGPAFLPWHREFLKRLEIGIRTTSVGGKFPYVDVAIPYWDSSMDADIKDVLGISSKFSVMFSNELMGSVVSGYVNDGQFGGFQGIKGWFKRNLDQWPDELTLLTRADVDSVIYIHTLNQVLSATAGGKGCPTIPDNHCEEIHGWTHVWVGGDMEDTATSPNDPIFFMHHSFIDFIWEQWRQKRQTRAQRESQYNTAPDFCYSKPHKADSAMVPFTNFIISDGLSNQYTDNMYTYEPRPNCSSTVECPSKFYFCNVKFGRCTARIKVGSLCKTVDGVDPCYRSVCNVQNGRPGRCVSTKMVAGETPTPGKALVPDKRVIEMCYNRQPCCEFVANPTTCADVNTKAQCPASCKTCTPKTYQLVDDCSNRHNLCSVFKRQGMCQSQAQFMAENCRKECGLCGTSRSEQCKNVQASPPSPGTGGTPLSTPPAQNKWCYNNDRCCSYWAKDNGCQKNRQIMYKVCPASCTCTPSFDLTKNTNFIAQCPMYASKGLCWLEFMKENCRSSCQSYLSPSEQTQQCAKY